MVNLLVSFIAKGGCVRETLFPLFFLIQQKRLLAVVSLCLWILVCFNPWLVLNIFCKGTLKTIKSLISLFEDYGKVSGQKINKDKFLLFHGCIPKRCMSSICNLLGFRVGDIPFEYLRVPIFKGNLSIIHRQPVVDKIKLKLIAWKGKLLSLMGRVQLVKSVIEGSLMYSFRIYHWPFSLINDIERYIRNFIWLWDKDQRNLVIKYVGRFMKVVQGLNHQPSCHPCSHLEHEDK